MRPRTETEHFAIDLAIVDSYVIQGPHVQGPFGNGGRGRFGIFLPIFRQCCCRYQLFLGKSEIVKGVCVEYDQKGVMVDIGAKASAYMPLEEAALNADSNDIRTLVKLDVPYEFQIISDEDEKQRHSDVGSIGCPL